MRVERHFPLGVRIWRWWCKNGLKRKSAGVVGGSYILRRLRHFYTQLPADKKPDGYVRFGSGHTLFVDVFDLHTYQLVLPQIESGDTELLLAKMITPLGGVFLDVGANVGVLSLLALSDSVAAVHSFEPNPVMMSLLRKTHANNQHAESWHLHESAIGSENGHLTLFASATFSGTASLNANWQGSGNEYSEIDVKVITLDHLYKSSEITRVDVLKMDVEGSEYAVLEGARNILRANRPYIWFEHNLPLLKKSGIDENRVLNTLRELEYEVFYDIGCLPDCLPFSRNDVDGLRDCRVNLLAVPLERDHDFNTRIKTSMRSLASESGA